MTDLSALEREVEESRARLKSSLTQLEQRTSPASLADEVLGLVGPRANGGIRRSARELALRHPVPLLVLGLGLSFAYWRTGRPPETWGRSGGRSGGRSRPAQMPNEPIIEAETVPFPVNESTNSLNRE
jgi:Protein of unknown function (DUF3618)